MLIASYQRRAGKKGKNKKAKSKPRAKKTGKFVNVTQKALIAGGTKGGGGGGGRASGGGGCHNTYAPRRRTYPHNLLAFPDLDTRRSETSWLSTTSTA